MSGEFWTFVENTPSGITIHKIDKDLDSGPIIYKKMVGAETKI